jgi:hypothetical protein
LRLLRSVGTLRARRHKRRHRYADPGGSHQHGALEGLPCSPCWPNGRPSGAAPEIRRSNSLPHHARAPLSQRAYRRVVSSSSAIGCSDKSRRPLLHEALCHEAAHLAVHRLFGSKAAPSGKEWRILVRSAGSNPGRFGLRWNQCTANSFPGPCTSTAVPSASQSTNQSSTTESVVAHALSAACPASCA